MLAWVWFCPALGQDSLEGDSERPYAAVGCCNMADMADTEVQLWTMKLCVCSLR